MNRVLCGAFAMCWLACSTLQAADDTGPAVTYDQVRPVFRKHCVGCHNSEQPRGNFDVSTIDAIQAGSGSGAVAVSGSPEESPLYTMPAHLEEPHMPPSAPKIPQRELDLIRRWITGGMQASAPAAKPGQKSSAKAVDNRLAPVSPVVRRAPLTALAASPTADIIAVSGHQQVALYSLADHKWLHAFPFPEGEVHVLKFSADGSLLLVGGGQPGASGKVIGVDTATGRREFELGEESDIVLAADLSPDRQWVALGGPGRKVKLFKVSDGVCVATLERHTDWILTLAFSPDGLLLASGDRFGSLHLWDVATGNEFATLRGHVGAVNGVTFADDSQRLLSIGADGTARWWDLHGLKEAGNTLSHPGGTTVVQTLREGLVLTGGRNRKAVLSAADFAPRWEALLTGEIVEIALSPNQQFAIVADAAGRTTILDVASGHDVGQIELPLDTVAAAQLAAIAPKPRRILPPTTVITETTVLGADEHAATLQALAAAEAAVKSAEESLERARELATQLKSIADRQSRDRNSADRAAP